VRRAQQGEAEAFSELVRQFQNMAVGYAYSILLDVDLAEDAGEFQDYGGSSALLLRRGEVEGARSRRVGNSAPCFRHHTSSSWTI